MKISLRLIVSLVLVATLVASVFSYVQVRAERVRLTDDLERRGTILAESLLESILASVRMGAADRLDALMERFGNRERLLGISVYDAGGAAVAGSPGLAGNVDVPAGELRALIAENRRASRFLTIGGRYIHVTVSPLSPGDSPAGALVVFHDASYIRDRLREIWKNNFIRLLTLCLLITITTVLVIRWSVIGPIARVADWLKGVRTGTAGPAGRIPSGDILKPLVKEVTYLSQSLAQARAEAEEEARLRISAESLWTRERLKEFIRSRLGGKSLYVISNREPYMHVYTGRRVEWIVPAGGVVTALDPILRACQGVWIAHGSGEADAEAADGRGRLRVPPDDPSYTLRRVWLSREEEDGYYFGFSNEGLWPLCHITHTRPIFRHEDWIRYQTVNQKFCGALLDEIDGEDAPLVLVQDYHFALLPLLIKARRPDAKVAIFWHIPWPNPEAFGICPWKTEILMGMLGADLVGFHTQFFCNNFLETVDRFLESKINWDELTIERRGRTTLLKPFPISVDFPNAGTEPVSPDSVRTSREDLFRELGISPKLFAVGVDRLDYTKGIIERFRAIERFLELHPEFVGEFVFEQIGAPSRTKIQRYYDLEQEIEETADKINWKFQRRGWSPILFHKGHFSHREIDPRYRAADACLVTSLHDGMNLVAKEFVAARGDEDGVLILSQFTGAAVELKDALIVNPYDIEEMAEAIHRALTMTPEERKERMRRLRATVRERNVYRWAGNLVSSLARVRLEDRPGG